MKILLVEDQADTRRRLRYLIERRGHDVTACENLAAAETELARSSYQFLVLDWMLPGENGLDLCAQLRARPDGDELFILVVSGRTDPADLKTALAAGASDYLTKPFHPEQLAVRLSVAERQIAKMQEGRKAYRALQETTDRMNNIIDKTSDGFFALDRDWKVTNLNAKAEKGLGVTQAQLLGANFWETFPALAGSAFEKNCRKVMSAQSELEFETCAEDGLTWFEVRAYPSGRGIFVFFRDISDRRQIDKERLTKSKLHSLGVFARGIAHDLNNALAVVSGKLRLAELEAPADSGNLLASLGHAMHAARHAERLSGQLLIFSREETPAKKAVAIGDLVRKATEFSLRGSNLRAEFAIADQLDFVEADARQVEQVMHALLINAREATPNAGSVKICVENFALEETSGLPLPLGPYLKISVADRGPGISEEITAKIFKPYFTTKATASGLGLAISNSLIEKHGGILQLEENSPAGATFSFYLPCISSSLGEENLTPNEKAKGEKSRRVLVMDDEATIRDLTEQLLLTLDCEVTAVAEGGEAVRVYKQAMDEDRRFDAVMLDATVRGGLGGAETIARLRELDPAVNAIICSGYADAAALSEYLETGFRAALPKPFTRRELAAALERVTETDEISASPVR